MIKYELVEIWGSLQAHRSVQKIDGGYGICPTIGTTDLGLPRLLYNISKTNDMMEQQGDVLPLNPYKDGTARTIKAQYHQSSMANFKRQDGLGATGVLMIPQATKQGYIEVEQGGVFDAAYPSSSTRRGRVQEGGKVTPAILTSNELSLYEGVKNGQFRIRKLTPRECFRLMGVSEENIDKIQAAGISNSQQYKMAGNSIVVDTLYHIFKKMFIDKENENNQLTLF